MSKIKVNLIPAFLTSMLLLAPAAAQVPLPASAIHPAPPPPDSLLNSQPAVTDDWLTFSHDAQRTGWDNGDTAFNPGNVSGLKLLWSTQLPTTPSVYAGQTLTPPVVIAGVKTEHGVKTLAYTISADSTLFAIDADTGKVFWQKAFPNPVPPVHPPTWLCTNSEQATPVIDNDKGIIYFTTIDGKLRGVSLADGAEKLTPTLMVAPYARNWSLNLFEDQVYTSGGRGCGGDAANPSVSGYVSVADISDPAHVTVQHTYTGYGRPDGPWNRGGPVLGPQGVYVATADGRYDPAAGYYGESVVAIHLGGRGIADSFTPSNWKFMNARDFDLGSGSPVVFPFHGRSLMAIGAKESVEYLLDAVELGGADHMTPLTQTPRLGNDPVMLEAYGIWGAPATWQNASGDRYIYIPMWNAPAKDGPAYPHRNGDLSQGSIMAFKVTQKDRTYALEPAWISGVAQIPDTPIAAGGVVFALATGEQTIQNAKPPISDNLAAAKFRNTPVGHEILYAFDAQTGQQLYSSGDQLQSWTHFTEPVVSHGKVFVVSYDGHIYAFGLK
jgi:outer membrane protein assembly factor BamB